MRRFAQDTQVPISRSRGEVDTLLREWGAKGIQWSDDFEHDKAVLRFIWTHEGVDYLARFSIHLPGKDRLTKHAVDGRSGRTSSNKLEALMAARGKQEHRLLLLWLKAALNAVDAGLVDAESLFLPFLEDHQGRTVAEIAVPRLAQLTDGGAARLLGDGR